VYFTYFCVYLSCQVKRLRSWTSKFSNKRKSWRNSHRKLFKSYWSQLFLTDRGDKMVQQTKIEHSSMGVPHSYRGCYFLNLSRHAWRRHSCINFQGAVSMPH
jgi:hypothetical protein